MRAGFLGAERERPAGYPLDRQLVFLLWGALGLLPALAWAAPTLTEVSGKVFVLKAGSATWGQISKGQILAGGDQVRTAAGSRATITFDDNSRIELGPNASFTIQEVGPQRHSFKLGLGFLKAWVSQNLQRRFEVRTPTAVCSVRGTHFALDVAASGATLVQMFAGLLAVADMKGNEVELSKDQRIQVTDKGLGPVEGEGAAAPADKAREAAKREVGLEMTKEEVQAAAALEAKNAIYQQGKAIIDVNGNRVRIEEYIIRPRPDEFKLVVLNDRSDRFDYFYYRGTFNKALPDDISVALRQLPGCIGAACEFFLRSFETGRSNTADNMLEVASGGHQVDVNNNGVASDRVEAAFDPATDRFVSLSVPSPGGVGNQPFFMTLFNDNRLTFNGTEHSKWAPSAAAPSLPDCGGAPCIQNTTTHVAYTNTTTLKFPPSCAPPNCTFKEAGVEHEIFYSENASGAIWDRFENYVISDEGKVARSSEFAGFSSGAEFKRILLKWNFQTIVTASEFKGRKIDLAVEPKIFIQSGLIP